MSSFRVTAKELDSWSERRSAQDQLPRLIRDLILSQTPLPRSLRMASGAAVQLGGWDGIVDTEADHPYVPTSVSGWEVSVRNDITRKANEDYRNRLDIPGPLLPAETTFVFATSRTWMGKEAWVEERRAENVWKDIHAIDGHDLEAWLSMSPSVHLLLAEELGQKPKGAIHLRSTWWELANTTHPPLTASLVIAGRSNPAEALRAQLLDNDLIRVAADSRDEALMFLAAVLDTSDETDTALASVMSRSIVATHPDQWSSLINRPEPLVLIPMFDDRRSVSAATTKGHSVVIPLGSEESDRATNHIQLERPSRAALKEELEALGIPRHKAEAVAKVGRRSFLSMRRKLARAPELEAPRWGSAENARWLIPALFMGSWDDSKPADLEILEELSGLPIEDCQRVFRQWASESDPPLRFVGGVWYVVSKEDVWIQVRSALSVDDVERLRQAVQTIFSVVDKKYELPAEQRLAAGLFPAEDDNPSAILHEGMADTLALMANRGDDVRLGRRSVQDWISGIVGEVFNNADGEWRLWASLSHVLPLFAEAVPHQFLAAIEGALETDPPTLIELFQDKDLDPLWVHSPHVELLWALERLCWSPAYLPQASLLLARLALLDPGGKTTSRPADSLRRVFFLHRPHTSADAAARLKVLETIVEREPAVGWQLLMDLIPERHVTVFSTNRPKHREWAPAADPSRTWGELFAELGEVVDLALRHVNHDGRRWAHFISCCDRLTKDSLDRVLDALDELDAGGLDLSSLHDVIDALRDLVTKHRAYSDADWALNEAVVNSFAEIYERLEPEDPIERNRWLFSRESSSVRMQGSDWRAAEAQLAEERRSAVREVFAHKGLEGLVDLSEGSDEGRELGQAVQHGDVLTTAEGISLLSRGLGRDDESGELARGYARAGVARHGATWITDLIASQNWSEAEAADLLLTSPAESIVWDLVEELGGEVPELYWRGFRPFGLSDREQANRAAQNLLRHGRPYSALMVLDLMLRDDEELQDSDIVVAALEAAPKIDPKTDPVGGGLSYHVERLLKRLEASGLVDDSKLAELEWLWLTLIDHTTRSAATLHRQLATDPALFTSLVRLIYRPDHEPEDGDGSNELADVSVEDQRLMARNARRLFDSWKHIPGQDEQGRFDSDVLTGWVDKAIQLTSEAGYAGAGMRAVGMVLARCPQGTDGHWPHESVRSLIERYENDELERGVDLGTFIGRGVTVRHPYEGGDQERGIAAQFDEDARDIAARSPRTAALLSRMADTYLEYAEGQDRDAELREDLD